MHESNVEHTHHPHKAGPYFKKAHASSLPYGIFKLLQSKRADQCVNTTQKKSGEKHPDL
jgi:hypothetical protein